jgi:hypothetical protein
VQLPFLSKPLPEVQSSFDAPGILTLRKTTPPQLEPAPILVCTSGYGVDAYNFSEDKPLELIDGGGLLYLLRQHAGIHARIEI